MYDCYKAYVFCQELYPVTVNAPPKLRIRGHFQKMALFLGVFQSKRALLSNFEIIS